jgi:hypothetical protein
MNNSITINCPSCQLSCSIFVDQVGTNVICPNCTQEFPAYQQCQGFDYNNDYHQINSIAKDHEFETESEDKVSTVVGENRIGNNFKDWLNGIGALLTLCALIYNIRVEVFARTEYGQKKWIEEIIEESIKKDQPEIERVTVKVSRFDQNAGGDVRTGYATISGNGETVAIVFKSNRSHQGGDKHLMEVMWRKAIGDRPYDDQIYNLEPEQQ